MSNALATLCGQAYGAGQFQNAGIYLQRSWIILLTTCMLVLAIHLYATPILKYLGQEKEIADLAGKYAILVIPYMFSYAINLPLMKFLQAQSKVNVIMYISIVTLVIQNSLLYIFINVFHWGMTGLAMASNISGWIFSVALVIYAIGWCKEGWNGLSWKAFKELWEFTKLSLGSSVMICLEQWYSACIMLLAGHLDNPVIAVGSFSIW
jgi:MATE family multidrug resistance protein